MLFDTYCLLLEILHSELLHKLLTLHLFYQTCLSGLINVVMANCYTASPECMSSVGERISM